MQNQSCKIIIKILWLLLIVISSVLLFSFMIGEYLFFSHRVLMYQGDNTLRDTNLYIPYQDTKIKLYTEKTIDNNNILSGGYISFRNSFVDGGDKDEKHLTTKIGLSANINLFSGNDLLAAESFFDQEFNNYVGLFGSNIATHQSLSGTKFLWQNNDTLLILGMIKGVCEQLIGCNERKYIIYAELLDRRLEQIDTDWFQLRHPELLFFRESIDLPVSRFGVFERIWYIGI